MSLYVCGSDDFYQLGTKPTTKNKEGKDCVDALIQIPFDLHGIQSISSGAFHSVIIKNKKVFGAGSDELHYIGGKKSMKYEKFTEITVLKDPIVCAACGAGYTIYLTSKGKVFECCRYEDKLFQIKISKKVIAIFAGFITTGAIDEEGAFYIIKADDEHNSPERYYLGSPAVDMACCFKSVFVLLLDGRIFVNGKLNNDSLDFTEVSSLKGMEIKKLSGYNCACAALTSDGRVFICGQNQCGQFGNGTTSEAISPFTEIRLNEEIKDVSCSDHTLFLTKSNKIYGCGKNDYFQLSKKINDENVLTPILLANIDADQVIAGSDASFILSGTGKLENPARAFFDSKQSGKKSSKGFFG